MSKEATRVGTASYRAAEHLRKQLSGMQDNASPAAVRTLVEEARTIYAQSLRGFDVPRAAVDRAIVDQLQDAENTSYLRNDLRRIPTLKLLETMFGKRFDRTVENLAPALQLASKLADAATQTELRALMRKSPVGKATTAQALAKELPHIAKLALLGEWPESSAGWLARATKVGVPLDVLERYFDIERVCREQRVRSIPERLCELARQGKWDAELERRYVDASCHLSVGRFTLSNARSLLETFQRENKGKQASKPTSANVTSRLAARVEVVDTDTDVGAIGAPEHSELLSVLDEGGIEADRAMPNPVAMEGFNAKAREFIEAQLTRVERDANAAYGKDPSGDFAKIVSATFEASWKNIRAAATKLLPKTHRDPETREALAALRNALVDADNWRRHLVDARVDLRFGETFPADELPPAIEYAGVDEVARREREEILDKLVVVAPPANHLDEHLLRQALNAFDISALRSLAAAGYTVGVTRYLITNAESDMPVLAGFAEGVHRHDGPTPRIVVRTYWRDGALQLDTSTLLHEFGHAFDLRLGGSQNKPYHLDDDFIEALKAEYTAFGKSFETQKEFIAEAVHRFLADPERMRGQAWLTHQVLAKNHRLASFVPDREAIARLQAAQVSAPAVNISPDPFDFVRRLERVNDLRAKSNTPLAPYVLEIDGDRDQGGEILAASLAHAMRVARSPGHAPFRNGEELVRIPAATFNDEQALSAVLAQTLVAKRGSLLYIDELAKIPDNSPGFKLLASHVDQFGGVAPVLLQGTSGDLDRMRNLLPTAMRSRHVMDALTPAQIAENIERRARSEGYALSVEAKAAFTRRAAMGGMSAANALWKAVKEMQHARVDTQHDAATKDLAGAMRVVSRDVDAARVADVATPEHRLAELIGVGGAKRVVRQILGHVALGTDAKDRPRLNLLFKGNPGTGKTTVAEALAQLLYEKKYLQRAKVAMPLIQDLVSGDVMANVKKLFDDNKGGVIFLDEMHQLNNTPEGRAAFLAMIPYLGNERFADTVFIGAGYDDEMMELIREVDKGGEGRFTSVPFDDHGSNEVAQVFDLMISKRKLSVSPEVREAALARVEFERRCMMNFGNARTVKNVIDGAINRRIERMAEASEKGAVDPALSELTVADFAPEPVVSKEAVWAEIKALRGMREIKSQLKAIANAIDVARALGEDPITSGAVSTNIVLKGPRGTGKTTLARILAKFFAAYGIVPTAKLVEKTGADLQGEFVGQTAGAVRKLFAPGWGGTVFLDEISGLAQAGGTFKFEAAKKMMTIIENARGRFINIIADYEDKIDLFYALDDGIESRYNLTLTTEPLSPEDARDTAKDMLEARKRTIADDELTLIRDAVAQFAHLPTYASGRDVRNLVDKIMTEHNNVLAGLIADNKTPANPKQILREAVVKACDAYTSAKLKSSSAKAVVKDEDGEAYATRTATRAATPAKPAQSGPGADDKVMKALELVNGIFAPQFGNDPKALAAARADLDSPYMRALASALGVSPEEAERAIGRVEEKLKDPLVIQKIVERFEFVCPYCKNTNGPNCAYINEPLEWKIANSLKKPWKETVSEVVGGDA